MGITRNEIRGTTPLDIKHVNDNFTTLWYDVYGNSKYAQKIEKDLVAAVARVTDAEGNISTISQTASAIESRVTTAEGNISSVTGRVTTAESTITQQAGQIATKVTQTEVDNSISALTIGGRNLILNSSKELRNSNVAQYVGGLSPDVSNIYYADYNLVPGDVITFKIYLDCTTNTLKGGRARISYYKPDNTYGAVLGNIIGIGEKGYSIVSHTIVAGYDRVVMLIGSSNTAVVTSEIVKYKEAKLEKGTKATDWTPAPEDIEGRMTTAESSITQNANNIALKVSTTDYTGTTVASLINQSADAIKIQAGHIALEGLVTVNENFKVLADGSMEAKNGKFQGVITTTDATGNTELKLIRRAMIMYDPTDHTPRGLISSSKDSGVEDEGVAIELPKSSAHPTYFSVGFLDSLNEETGEWSGDEAVMKISRDASGNIKTNVKGSFTASNNIQAGSIVLNENTATSIKFPVAMMQLPAVTLTPYSNYTGKVVTAKITAISATGFSAIIQGTPAAGNVTFFWIAVCN